MMEMASDRWPWRRRTLPPRLQRGAGPRRAHPGAGRLPGRKDAGGQSIRAVGDRRRRRRPGSAGSWSRRPGCPPGCCRSFRRRSSTSSPDGTVVLIDEPVREYTLSGRSGLTDVVHTRVRRSVAASRHLDFPGGGGWVVLRRVPGPQRADPSGAARPRRRRRCAGIRGRRRRGGRRARRGAAAG